MNICVDLQQVYIWHVCMYLQFCARKFLSFEKLCVHFVPLADFFKTSKISEISECLFVQLSILTDCLLQALIQASQSSASCSLHTPYELCECRRSTIRLWIFWHDILFASQSWWSIPFFFLDMGTKWQATIQALWQAFKGLVKQDNPPHLSPHPSSSKIDIKILISKFQWTKSKHMK